MSGSNKPKIAVVASFGLGDGLLFLIIVNILQRNGYDVVFYSDYIAQLQNFFPNINVQSFPDKKNYEAEFYQYDLVLSEAVTLFTVNASTEDYEKLAKKYIFIGMSRFSRSFVYDRSAQLKEKIKDTVRLQKLLPIVQASGALISNYAKYLPMTERVALFCEKQLKLRYVKIDLGLAVPRQFSYRKYIKRVIIHPLSAEVVKNWLLSKYIKLAKLLKKNNWTPVFILSPKERVLHPIFKNSGVFTPYFKTLSELSAFIFESGWMIGNDSGIGHLASALHIPTVTITKKNKYYRWRPGWFHGIIVTSFCRIKFINKYFWKYFISVKKVFNAFNNFVNQLQEGNSL